MGRDVVVLAAACVIGLSLGFFFVIRWGRLPTRATPESAPSGISDVLLRFLRTSAIGVSAGAVAGILTLGVGGRLSMRILAATSGDDAQGALTEAEERVGEVTFGGSLGFVIFVGVFGGILGGLVYMALRRWLPGRAWMAGIALGLLLLFVARLDPLDPDSVDLDLLSPDVVSVGLFLALFPLYGMVLASLVARFDRGYPTLSRRPSALAAYLPLVPIVLVPPAALALVVGAGVSVLAHQAAFSRAWSERGVDIAGRVLLVAGGLVGIAWVCAGVGEIVGA